MALSFARKEPGIVGLDVDGDYLAAAIVERGSIDRLVSAELESGVTTDGEVSDPKALGEALAEMFARHKLPKRVRLGVANQQIVVRQLDMPVIEDPVQRDAAVRFQAAEAIAMPLEDAVLDHQVIGAREVDGNPRHTVLVVAARTSMVTGLIDAVKEAGLKPDGLDLNAFALVRVLGEAADDPAGQSARVLCRLGGVTNLAIATGSVCQFARALQTTFTSGDESTVHSLAEELRLSIDYYGAQPGARPVEAIVLSGPDGEDAELSEALAARTSLPVEVAPALGTLGTHAVPSLDEPARYTVAAGLALGAEA